MPPQSVISGSRTAMRLVAGATTEPRIRINRPDDANARCRVLRVRVQPRDFSQATQPHTTLSTSNATSPQQERTEPSGKRPCRHGVRSSPQREPDVRPEFYYALYSGM